MSRARMEYAWRVLSKDVKSVFMSEDLQQLKTHAWQLETPVSAYLLQCEGIIRAKMSSASTSENGAAEVEYILLRMRQEDLTNPDAWLLRAGQAFLHFTRDTCAKLDIVENLKQAQAELQTLYRDYMDALERAAVAEEWTPKDILETKGVAKEKMVWAQQELANQTKLRKTMVAHTKFNRGERAIGQLMSNVSVQADGGNAVALVETTTQLQGESCLLDTEVPEMEHVDPALAEKAEELRMAAKRSAAKGKTTLRRLTSEDGYSSAAGMEMQIASGVLLGVPKVDLPSACQLSVKNDCTKCRLQVIHSGMGRGRVCESRKSAISVMSGLFLHNCITPYLPM